MMIKLIINKKWPSNIPFVSIIIPCYNYGNYIEEAIDSVLNQTFKNIEIIVIDDGSTDPHTIEVLKKLKKPKTKIIFQKNSKISKTRNNGIKLAQGKYICCLDADDKFEPTYIEKCITKMEKENLDICSTWVREFGDIDNIWETQDLNINLIINYNTLAVASLFRKDAWEKVGGYCEDKDLTGYQDWEFWISIAEIGGRGKVIQEPLFLYRKHGKSMLDESSKKRENLLKKIKELHPKLYEDEYYRESIARKQNRKYIILNPYINLKS